MKRIALVASMLLCAGTMFLTGCGKPAVIRTADQQVYEESYKAMTKGMDAAKKSQLDLALAKFVAFGKNRFKKEKGKSESEIMLMSLAELEGMTADEIIQTAQMLR